MQDYIKYAAKACVALGAALAVVVSVSIVPELVPALTSVGGDIATFAPTEVLTK